jgi:transmembrane sensor
MSWNPFRHRARLQAARRAAAGAKPVTRMDRDFQALWHDLDQLRSVAFPARESARRRWRMREGRRWGLPFAVAACALTLVAFAAGVAHYRNAVPTLEAGYATTARPQLVTLADGSTLRLNVDTRIAVRYFRNRREVRLDAGEVFLSVTRDERSPFDVDAGALRIRVVGTQFNVRRQGDLVSVAVREGRVAAFRQGAAAAIAMLSAGERARFSAGVPEGAVARMAPDAAGAWSQGWIKLEDATLAELVAELGRYRAVPLQVDPDAGELRVSGAFRIDDLPGVLHMLPRVLPVTVTPLNGGYAIRRTPEGAAPLEAPRPLETPLPR